MVIETPVATRTIHIGGVDSETTAPIAVPDKHPMESPTAYDIRVALYLTQRFGEGGWSNVAHSRAAEKDLNALLTVRAELDPRTRGGNLLAQLTRRGHHIKRNKYPKKR